eukprot:7383809-Prymnesium_polylepis.1
MPGCAGGWDEGWDEGGWRAWTRVAAARRCSGRRGGGGHLRERVAVGSHTGLHAPKFSRHPRAHGSGARAPRSSL